ncbi:MAG: SurA N-terminal domain-containing protein [Candidatus Omnitrophica bacterium]|nr:SurA N-terminal domain-containing protein [Candidatus Omnitrophota bacterium]
MQRIIDLRLFLLLLLLPIYYTLHAACPLYAQDQIVAVVNNEVITQKDLSDFLNFMSMQLSRQYKGKALEDKIDSIKSDLLNRLIEDRLILQEAKKEKIMLDENRVKAKIGEIKKQYRSDAEFQAELMKQGLTQADIENKVREQFLMFSIVERQVRSKITVKPDEVTGFYEKNKNDFNSGEERELEAYSLENEDLAQSFAYNLKTGKKPEDLATRYPFTVNMLSVYKGEQLKSEIEEVVFKLGLNEVSKPVNIDGKFYVFRLVNISPPKEATLTQVQGKIHNFLFETKMQEEFTRWLDELKKRSYIKIK